MYCTEECEREFDLVPHIPANDAQRLMINGGEDNDISEISDFESDDVLSSDGSFGFKEANRSTEETNVHSEPDLFVFSLSFELAFGDVDFVSLTSMSSVISLSIILLLRRRTGRLFDLFGTFKTGV